MMSSFAFKEKTYLEVEYDNEDSDYSLDDEWGVIDFCLEEMERDGNFCFLEKMRYIKNII